MKYILNKTKNGEMKVNEKYIYDTLIENLNLDKEALGNPNHLIHSRIKALWSKIQESYTYRPYFNFDYLAKLCRHYQGEVARRKGYTETPINLAVIFSHVFFMRRTESLTHRYGCFMEILNDLEVPHFKAAQVIELMKSKNNPFIVIDWTQKEFLDLILYTFVDDYEVFKANQAKLLNDRPSFLKRGEFISGLIAFYGELLKRHFSDSLFLTYDYKTKYEEIAANNLAQYIQELRKMESICKLENVAATLNS